MRPATAMVTAMTVMHEDVHQRAAQNQQVRQGTDDMRQMLSQQEITCNRPDDDQTDRVAGTKKTGRTLIFSMLMVQLRLQKSKVSNASGS